jgi:hypothetical protein
MQPQAAQLDFTLEALPVTHEQLRIKLRNEFETHQIISFSSSEQE